MQLHVLARSIQLIQSRATINMPHSWWELAVHRDPKQNLELRIQIVLEKIIKQISAVSKSQKLVLNN